MEPKWLVGLGEIEWFTPLAVFESQEDAERVVEAIAATHPDLVGFQFGWDRSNEDGPVYDIVEDGASWYHYFKVMPIGSHITLDDSVGRVGLFKPERHKPSKRQKPGECYTCAAPSTWEMAGPDTGFETLEFCDAHSNPIMRLSSRRRSVRPGVASTECVPNGRAIWEPKGAKAYLCSACHRPIFSQNESDVAPSRIECKPDEHILIWEGAGQA